MLEPGDALFQEGGLTLKVTRPHKQAKSLKQLPKDASALKPDWDDPPKPGAAPAKAAPSYSLDDLFLFDPTFESCW